LEPTYAVELTRLLCVKTVSLMNNICVEAL